jgi:hypothetical protein
LLPKDAAGIFSRFFISGFFLPAFFTLTALWLTLSEHFEPASFRGESKQVQLLVLGGLALLFGLLLQGLRYPLIRIFEGYGIQNRLVLRPLLKVALPLQRRSYRRIEKQACSKPVAERARRRKWLLDRRFPNEIRDLLPTRFGNAFRAFEDYPYTRWGLDMIAVYPRVDALLTQREQELHWNAYTDVMLFLNLTVGAIILGCLVVADDIAHDRLGSWLQFAYVTPFLLSYLLYRFAIGAAERLGAERRVSVDLHRFDVYEALGFRQPLTFTDEREKIAPAVNNLVLYGDPVPDCLRHENVTR